MCRRSTNYVIYPYDGSLPIDERIVSFQLNEFYFFLFT